LVLSIFPSSQPPENFPLVPEPRDCGLKSPSIFARLFPEFDVIHGCIIDIFHKFEIVSRLFGPHPIYSRRSKSATELPRNNMEGFYFQKVQGRRRHRGPCDDNSRTEDLHRKTHFPGDASRRQATKGPQQPVNERFASHP